MKNRALAIAQTPRRLKPAALFISSTERGNAHKYTKTIAAYDSDARAALDYLKAQPYCTGKLGTMGICLGGHLAFRAAMQPDVLAGACLYATDIHTRSLGQGGDNSLDRVSAIRSELLLIWGRQDPTILFSIGDRIARTLPCRRFVVLQALHRPHQTVPDTVAFELNRFLAHPACDPH